MSNIIKALLILIMVVSCHRYYMPVAYKTNNTAESASFISEKKQEKYFILHSGDSSYALNDISVDQTKLTMSGTLSPVSESHLLYIKAKKKKYTYKGKPNAVLNEVHIYVNNFTPTDTVKSFELPLEQVNKIEVIEHDKNRTTSSYVLGGIAIGMGAMVIAGVIVLLTKSSCPFISVYDGEQFQLQGELFGGAVNPQLERMDYVPLNASRINGEYQVRISNELKEKQFTNFADLLVIEHSENTKVLPDPDGNLYEIKEPVLPISARLNQNADVLPSVSEMDNIYCSFNDTTSTTGINELHLTFQRKENDKKAKLLLHIKNSYWFDYLYGQFTQNFGSKYKTWKQKQQNKPASEMIRWTEEQNIPLTISLETKDGWKQIRNLKTIGPLANRSLVIPIELDNHSADPIHLKLSTGFMFWEIDYAAIDFSDGQPLNVTRLKPVYAEEGNGNNVLSNLHNDDNMYLSQPEVGNYAILKYSFNQQPKKGNTFSVVFHAKGYYEPIREYSGKPNMDLLQKFKEPGFMPIFSLHNFQKVRKEQSILAVNKY